MRPAQARLSVGSILCASLIGLAGPAAARATPVDAERDAGVRASLDRDGRPFAVGVVGELVVAVRTPPGHRLLPLSLPKLSNAEIVRHNTEVREHSGGGWLHRTRIRVRPLAAEPLRWPALDIHVDSPDGVRTRVALPERVFEVNAVMRGVEDERAPFGLRGLEKEEQEGLGFATGLLAGSLSALLCVGLVAWRRVRRRQRASAPLDGADTAHPAFDRVSIGSASDPLDAAQEVLDRNPREAANMAAASLRALASERLRVDLRAKTTDELRQMRASAAPKDLILELVQSLERLDAARFRDRLVSRDEIALVLSQSARTVERLMERGGRRG